MKQSRFMSGLETVLSTAAGFGISILAQWYFLPLIGVSISLTQNVTFAVIMTFVSLARQFVLRRVFEALHIRVPMSPAAHAVIEERFRQQDKEGWSVEHDDEEHEPGDLAIAGAAYARMASWHLTQRAFDAVNFNRRLTMPDWWPWAALWWKPTDFRRDLIKAAALILAEIEKFDRSRKQKKRAF
jgi:hypothetical protein